MPLFATLALQSGVLYPGQPTTAVVTVFSTEANAYLVLGIDGLLYTGGTNQAQAPGYLGAFAIGPGQNVTIPAGGNVVINGTLVFHGSQAFETDTAGDRSPAAVEATEIQSQLNYDCICWVRTNDPSYSYISTPRCNVRYQPLVFVAPNGASPGVGASGQLAVPQPAVGQADQRFASQSNLIPILGTP